MFKNEHKNDHYPASFAKLNKKAFRKKYASERKKMNLMPILIIFADN
jgi:hypothetical protein